MAQTEKKTPLAGLKIETSFQERHRSGWLDRDGIRAATPDRDGIEGDRTNIFHDSGARARGTDQDSSVLSELHSATPPISVPRPDEPSSTEIRFPHKPDDVQASPLDNFLHNRRPSISFSPNVTLDSGRQHALEEPLAKGDIRNRPSYRSQAKPSGLRNALSHDENDGFDSTKSMDWASDPKRIESRRALHNGNSRLISSPEDDMSTGSELDRLSSLTSASPASPFSDELRTPPEPKGFWPFCVASPIQQFPQLDERSSWSGASLTTFGSKPRGFPLERNSSFRNGTRRSSRRSTASSAKSPASAFLSMWSSREEPAPQPDDEGQMVGTDYVLGKQIGFGGFSTVKEAFKVETDGSTKRLAVKIVKKHVSGKNEIENDQVQAEFDHEVRVWRYLNNPHVLTLDAVYETDYATFCFTKLAIGGTLFDLVRQNRHGLDIKLAKKYTYQLACALRYLHEDARVVHRDIKLENCLLDPVEWPDGTKTSNLVLCDFGMAEWMSTDNGTNSPDPYEAAADRPPPKNIGPSDSSTSIAGSLEYASPELLLSTNGVINPAVDIWAFGVVVFTVVVGSRPFSDAFMPRIRSNIINGSWNREAVQGDIDDRQTFQNRADALELIQGCLELDVDKRWTIRDVLASRWFGGYQETSDENLTDTTWRL